MVNKENKTPSKVWSKLRPETHSATLLYMNTSDLATYVATQLKSGKSAEEIKQNLLLVGWSEEDAGSALVAGLVQSGIPAPERVMSGRGRLASTVEVILSLFSFILLGIIASALAVLYYQVINNYFPDPLVGGYGYSDASAGAINYAIAALIIAFPIYVTTMRLWFRRYREDEAKIESKLTKWLTYLVLLVAAITIVGDLVTAVFYFLQGEITARFFLKALTILVISGVVFGFYYLERKKVQYKNDIPRKTFQLFAWVVLGLVLIAIGLGFSTTGSPSTQRMRGLDNTRAQDLSTIAGCISNYAAQHKALPSTLNDLTLSTEYAYCAEMKDPETGAPYSYHIITKEEQKKVNEGTFELCATFSLETTESTLARDSYSYGTTKWAIHSKGESCDTETVTLDRSTIQDPKMMLP